MTVRKLDAFERPCDVYDCRNSAQYSVRVSSLTDDAIVCAEHTGFEVRSYWGDAVGCSACYVGRGHIDHNKVTQDCAACGGATWAPGRTHCTPCSSAAGIGQLGRFA